MILRRLFAQDDEFELGRRCGQPFEMEPESGPGIYCERKLSSVKYSTGWHMGGFFDCQERQVFILKLNDKFDIGGRIELSGNVHCPGGRADVELSGQRSVIDLQSMRCFRIFGATVYAECSG